jgi:fructosamine-3-kinase
MIDRALQARIEAELGQRVLRATSLAGGDINLAFELELANGERLFLKTNPSAPAELFTAEARGLELLAAARALRIPKVIAVSAAGERPSFLLLEFIRSQKPRPDFADLLGQGLAALHRAPMARFGLDHSNFIGLLEQRNREHASWAEFYRAERLEPQLRRAIDGGRAPRALADDFARLFQVLPQLLGEPEPPALVHGDLWSGNVHVDEQGAPCLIDPAVYGGQREVDLAMMKLFGGFSARVFAAYHEAFPLLPGHEERVPLYQLYPLLVHVNLFGGGYLDSVRRVLAAYC